MDDEFIYFQKLSQLVMEVDPGEFRTTVDWLWENYAASRRLVICGNGGSGATASHLVADFQKNIQMESNRAWECISLVDSSPLLTAWSNDTDFQNVFAGQAQCWLRKGDLLIAISGSGNSPNVLAAVDVAREKGARSIGLCGFGGGALLKRADHCLTVHSDDMQLVEDIHLAVGHALYRAIRSRVRSQQSRSSRGAIASILPE